MSRPTPGTVVEDLSGWVPPDMTKLYSGQVVAFDGQLTNYYDVGTWRYGVVDHLIPNNGSWLGENVYAVVVVNENKAVRMIGQARFLRVKQEKAA